MPNTEIAGPERGAGVSLTMRRGVHTSWATVRETLKTHQVNTIVLPANGGLTLRLRQGSTPEPAHRELYQKLGIGAEIIPPRKTWTRVEEGSK